MSHLNNNQLREYAFNLLSETEAAQITAHLETCETCQQSLLELRQTFSALDVLKEQLPISEQAVAAVLKRRPKRKKVIPFRTIASLAAAASIAVCLSLFHPNSQPLDEVATVTVDQPTLAELRAEQPFAPASNIELNVLPRRDEVQLTIYNAEDLTLVREKRTLTLKRGWNWLQFMWSNTLIDPTSLSLEPQTHTGEIEIAQLVYPPRLNDLARWTIFSEFSGEAEFELTYFTSGLKWRAFYEATLAPDEQSMELKNYVRIDNGSGEDYENAETRLVVGKIKLNDKIATLARRREPYGSPVPVPSLGGLESLGFSLSTVDFMGCKISDATAPPAVRKKITKKALSEYQLYTIEGQETIPDGWGKRLPSMQAENIAVTNLYKFEAERWGNQTMRFLSFENDELHQLGQTPLPKGRVRVCSEVGDKLRYIGAADINYIPVGSEAELELGAARKVSAEPKLMKTRTANYEFDSRGNVSGWDEISDWRIELTNAKAIPVTIEVMRATGSHYWELSTDELFEKYDAGHVRFSKTVAPQRSEKIEYTLTVRCGSRKEK